MGREGSGALADALGGSENVLVVAPTGSEPAEAACVAASTVADPAEALVVGVAYGVSPEARIEAWRRTVGTTPKRGVCIAVGEHRRSAAADGVVPCSPDPGAGMGVVVDVVSDRTDVGALGERITRRLADWDYLEGQRILCFHSITAMLEAVDLQPTFQFLQLLTRQVDHVDGVAHYHLDPDVVGRKARATLRPLFDVVVTPDPAGGLSVTEA
ncbi:MAG TPA: hypothetical protein VKA37_03025 [Halobacteriales archaeon]|nr:hypothetical protein [Halobacteriales archaeon]